MKWKKRLVKVTKLCVKDLIFQWNVFRWQFTSRFMANEGISLMKLLFFVLMLWLCFCTLTEGSSPMSTRNFPPSFWDSNYVPPIPAHPQVSLLCITLRFSSKNVSFLVGSRFVFNRWRLLNRSMGSTCRSCPLWQLCACGSRCSCLPP